MTDADAPDGSEPSLPPSFRAVPGFNVAPGYVPPIPGGPAPAPSGASEAAGAAGEATPSGPTGSAGPPADALTRAWRRQWRPTLLFLVLLVAGGAITAWAAPQEPGGPAAPIGGQKLKGEVTEVSASTDPPSYAIAVGSQQYESTSDEGLAVGDPVWVLTDDESVSIEPRMPEWLFAAVVIAAVVALYSLIALVVSVMRRSGRRRQARDGWELVRLRSQGQGLPKRTLSPRLLLNAITLPLGIRILAKRSGGRWYRFEAPSTGSFRPRTRRGAKQLDQASQAWVPRGVATPRLVLPVGSGTFELADAVDGNPDGAPRTKR
ncbi:MAG: hypothetical protein JWO77_3805 [Ilumatobacteraceae bacterium]|nr:hypothetical protein [Ilumatobacteraceae bacterium]